MFSATEFWFWFDEPGAPVTSMPESVTLNGRRERRHHRDAVLVAFWGNSPETMVAQLVAEEFDCDPHDVSIVYQGSRNGLPATGPGGSPHHGDARRRGRGRHREDQGEGARAAAHLLEANPDDLEWSDGGFEVKGVPEQRKALAEIAVMLQLFKHSFPRTIESGLEESKVFDHPYTTMPRPTARPRRLLPVHGQRLPRPGGRGGHRDRRGCRSSNCARGARLRHAGEPAVARRPDPSAAPRRASAPRCTRSTSTTTTGRCSPPVLHGLPDPDRAWRCPRSKIGHLETPSPWTPTGSRAAARAAG